MTRLKIHLRNAKEREQASLGYERLELYYDGEGLRSTHPRLEICGETILGGICYNSGGELMENLICKRLEYTFATARNHGT